MKTLLKRYEMRVKDLCALSYLADPAFLCLSGQVEKENALFGGGERGKAEG